MTHLGRVIAFATLIASCTSFSATEDKPTPTPTPPVVGVDAGSRDADAAIVAVDREAGAEAGRTLGENLLSSDDSTFEGTDCGANVSFRGTLAISKMNPHGGTSTCKVCRSETNPFYTINTLAVRPQGGDVFHAVAWVRRDAPMQDQEMALILRGYFDTTTDVRDEGISAPPLTLSPEWQKLEATVRIANGSNQLDMYVRATSGAVSPCFYVDDLDLRREQ